MYGYYYYYYYYKPWIDFSDFHPSSPQLTRIYVNDGISMFILSVCTIMRILNLAISDLTDFVDQMLFCAWMHIVEGLMLYS